jgi:hypothetical protein
MALIMFVAAAVLWWILLGWLVHIWSILDAAMFKPIPKKEEQDAARPEIEAEQSEAQKQVGNGR